MVKLMCAVLSNRKIVPNSKYITLLILVIVNNFTISAQHNIELSFKDKAFERFSLVIHKGNDVDTLYTGHLDISGYSYISVMDTVLPGIGSLVFDNKRQLDFILNKENFRVENSARNINILNIKYINSNENTYFQDYLSGIKTTIDSSLYASKLIHIIDFISRDASIISDISLDWPSVYTSGLWNTVIDKWINNNLSSGDQDCFIKEIIEIVNEIQVADIKSDFINYVLRICEHNQWQYIEYKLVEYFYLHSELLPLKGDILDKMRKIGVLIGDHVPDFIFDNGVHLNGIKSNKILIFFFDTTCDNCQKEVQELIKKYQRKELEDIAIVSVSVDQNIIANDVYNRPFPWKNHKSDICGEIATKFGIFYVPSFLLIEKGILTKRMKKMEEIVLCL